MSCIGFGVDYQFQARYPHGLQQLLQRNAARLSHVSAVAIPTVEAAREVKSWCGDLPIIHHLSNVAPANPEGADLSRLAHLDEISRALAAAWCGEDIGIWSLGPYDIPYFVPPLFEADVAERTCEQIRLVMQRSSVPFLAEVPSCAFVAGRLTLGDYFRILVEGTGCGIVLDLSHVLSYALATDGDAMTVLRSLPLDHVGELHIAGGRVDQRFRFRYIDSHSDPVLDSVLELLRASVASCRNLRAITYEIGVQLTERLIEQDLTRIERAATECGFQARI